MSAAWERQWLDYYEILQVSPRAEPEVVVAAYRRLAAKYHPDLRGTGDLERMKLINMAREVLCDASARTQYDVARQARNRASSVTEEDVRRAQERERRAQNAAESARREAKEARAQVEHARQEAQAAREARDRVTGSPVAGSSTLLPQRSETTAEDAPSGGFSFSWLDLLANIARATLAPEVSGAWNSMDGLTYLIQQQGNQVSFQGTNGFGMVVTVGGGQLIGRRMQLQYRLADGTSGTANTEISLDSRHISGMATNLFSGLTTPVLLSR